MISVLRHKDPARGRLLVLAMLVLGAIVAIGLTATAGADRARELGKTKKTPQPSCPTPDDRFPPDYAVCNVNGQVTGFQRSVDGKNGLFKVRAPGRIVGWSVSLSRPNREERGVFEQYGGTERHGNGPTAGISIIRKTDHRKYKLKSNSPIVKLGGYLKDRPVITLDDPLRVRKGDIVAITTPTWLPHFARKRPGQPRLLSKQNVWVASRPAKHCNVPPGADNPVEYFFNHTRPHTNVDSERKYACIYDQARLLYWAYFVPA